MNLTEIFCDVDDFCKEFMPAYNKYLLSNKKRIRLSKLTTSEVMTILIIFHFSGYRTFKWFYNEHVCKYLTSEFPKLVSYNRFVELKSDVLIPLFVYLKYTRTGARTGINFIDSTHLKVCDNRRINQHKVFKGIAKRGKTSIGWFYGFKLHIIINEKGEILNFVVTAGNVDDRSETVVLSLTKGLSGKLFGDRGYISQSLFEKLLKRGMKLVTKIKKNMKNKLMELSEKILLRRRAVIESVNEELKGICQIQHTRHRSVKNWCCNLLSGLIAYSFFPKKPSLNLEKDGLLFTL